MEVNNLLKDVIHLNEYIIATQDVLTKYKNVKVALNIATVLTLKKIRSLEIEYLNKCDDNGVACIIFERLLATPPSKVWRVLAKELVNLLQYWLEAIRKHLVNHSAHWWMFLKLILKFLKEIRLKDPSIPNMLVELTAECLLDLATAPQPDVFQRHEILHCLNMVCAESGREIRFAMRTKFGEYFVKLAHSMVSCAYLPCQYSAVECLMRWLVPRQESALRAAAAARWLPPDLCPQPARTLFLTSRWMNFFQDARYFLNALNEGNGLVTSVICRKLSIGEIDVINGTERQQYWLDFNMSGKSVSVLLDPRVLETLGVAEHRACETLVVDQEITETAVLHRELLGLTISVNTHRPPCIRPIDISAGESSRITIVVSSKTDLNTLDGALRNTFGDKYQCLLELDTELSQSPQRSCNKNRSELNSEEDTRFSHPVEVKRRKHSGYIVRNKNTGGSVSPSTASTSSLHQLKDRLAALPRYKYDKEPVSVCAQPALSNVTEITERDDRSVCTATTIKFQPYGVCHKSVKAPTDQNTSIKSRSEGESVKPKSRGGRRLLSPVVSDDNSTSLLLVATIGSADDSVINETVQRLSKSKDFNDDNIVDLLVQEALQAKPKSREVSDSGINTDEKKSQEESEAVDDTPNETKEFRSKVHLKKICTVVSKSTTDDESNTEAINETPAFVYTRKYKQSSNELKSTEKQSFHANTIEEFFSQHIAENGRGEIVINPTLAKKINETSSETSENFDDNYFLANEEVHTDVEQAIFNDIDVIDCLNDMVDKVCSDFDKCTEYLFKESTKAVAKETSQSQKEAMADQSYLTLRSKQLEVKKPKRNIKLKYKPVKKAKARVTKNTKTTEQEISKKMSTIIEQKEEDTILGEINPDKEKATANKSPLIISEIMHTEDITMPLQKRKRKLYSPKNDDIENDIQEFTVDKTSDDIPLSEIKHSKNVNTTATSYKELEKERKKYTRRPRSRKSKKILEMPSPRTIEKNSVFDSLKQTVESSEKITLVDRNTDVYNFTSESEDEDFKKKVEIKKRVNTTAGTKTAKKGRNARRAKETDSSYEEASKVKIVKRKKGTKWANKRSSEVKVVDLVDDKIDLIDQRMREAREELNTSVVVEQHANLEIMELEPALKESPQMEEICDNDTIKKATKNTQIESLHDSASNDTLASKKRTYKRAKKSEMELSHDDKSNDTLSKKKVNKRLKKNAELLIIKKEKGLKDKTITVDKEDEGTISPLPGLVVESMPKYKEDANDSLTTNMMEKFKRIYQDGPDVINDSVNTQNMLSDLERFNHSAQNITIADQVYFEDYNNINIDKKAVNGRQQRGKKTVPTNAPRINVKNISNEQIEVIETIDIPDKNDQSEKSFASDDINAHGDIDEAPPNPDTIKENLQPRELQDLDQSMQDYFTKLTREIHRSTSNGREDRSVEGKHVNTILHSEIEKAVGKSAISPVVSVKRMSFEDISKWMPSRRTSDTDSYNESIVRQNEQSQKTRTQVRINDNSADTTPKSTVQTRKPPETSTPDSKKIKSPTLQIPRLSLEEFEKWLPMPKSFEPKKTSPKERSNDLKLVYRTRSKTKENNAKETQSISKQKGESVHMKKNTKDAKSNRIETDPDSDFDTNVKDSRKLGSKTKSHKDKELNKLDNDSDEAKKMSQTILTFPTPLKTRHANENRETHAVFNVSKKRTKMVDKDSGNSPSRNKAARKAKPSISPIKLDAFETNINNTSSDDECLKKIRSMFSKTKDTKYSNRDQSKSIEKSPVPLKRKSSSPILSERKKRFLEPKIFEEPRLNMPKKIEVLEDVVISESGPSVSSVNNWFKRAGPMGFKGSTSMSYKDTIQNVMEKLDTTLVEINQNTSKKFVNLFVETQKNLCEQKVEQRNLYKQVAKDMISEMVRVMDEKFADLDKKSQEMGNNFMEKLKKQAFEMISEDCKQKRVMVLLLREDVQAVMDSIERSTDSQ